MEIAKTTTPTQQKTETTADNICPFCGERSIQEKCKVICRSEICTYRIIYNCSEF